MIVQAKVIDNAGTLIPNAHIVSGSRGTVTDFDGKFSINVINEFDTIQISHVGMQTQTFNANQVPKIVRLQDSGLELGEVVLKSKKEPFYKNTYFKLGVGVILLTGVLVASSKATAKGLSGYKKVSL